MKTRIAKRDKDLADWLAQADALLADIEKWAKEQRWLVHRETKPMHDEAAFENFEKAELRIRSPEGNLVVTPVVSSATGADGRVEIRSWPSMDRFWLVRSNDEWVLTTDGGIRWPQPWGRDAFVSVANAIIDAS